MVIFHVTLALFKQSPATCSGAFPHIISLCKIKGCTLKLSGISSFLFCLDGDHRKFSASLQTPMVIDVSSVISQSVRRISGENQGRWFLVFLNNWAKWEINWTWTFLCDSNLMTGWTAYLQDMIILFVPSFMVLHRVHQVLRYSLCVFGTSVFSFPFLFFFGSFDFLFNFLWKSTQLPENSLVNLCYPTTRHNIHTTTSGI